MIIKDGEIKLGKGYGMANIEAELSFDSNTPSNLASLTKQFTATAVLILVEREFLNLDTKIIEHFSELPSIWSEITIHHLMTHQSGIPNYTDFIQNNMVQTQGLTTQDIFERIIQRNSLDFIPGEQVSYSNSGFLILALLVERITNMSFQ